MGGGGGGGLLPKGGGGGGCDGGGGAGTVGRPLLRLRAIILPISLPTVLLWRPPVLGGCEEGGPGCKSPPVEVWEGGRVAFMECVL